MPQGICVIGVKVSDMNLPGNEIELQSANLERLLSKIETLKRTIPENSIVFPKARRSNCDQQKTTHYRSHSFRSEPDCCDALCGR